MKKFSLHIAASLVGFGLLLGCNAPGTSHAQISSATEAQELTATDGQAPSTTKVKSSQKKEEQPSSATREQIAPATEEQFHPAAALSPHPAVSGETLIRRVHIGDSQNVSVDSLVYLSDGLRVKARLYLPHNCTSPLPLVIFNHDGVSGISSCHHKSSLRLASLGYAVISPTYRGEDGSEGTVEIAKGEVRDVLNIWSLLPALPEIDSSRIALMGASHGALISLLACAQKPEVKGLIFAYGVADIYSWWDYLRANNKLGKDIITRNTYGDGPESRPQSFALRHGLSAVPALTMPTLILQGELDDITPPQQGKALHQALQDAGKESQLCLYPQALHGFLVYAPYLKTGITPGEKQQTEIAWGEVQSFLNRVLLLFQPD